MRLAQQRRRPRARQDAFDAPLPTADEHFPKENVKIPYLRSRCDVDEGDDARVRARGNGRELCDPEALIIARRHRESRHDADSGAIQRRVYDAARGRPAPHAR